MGELNKRHSKVVWKGIESMVGMQKKDRIIFYTEETDAELTEELNKFYSKFDIHDFNKELSDFINGPAGCKIKMDEVCKSFGRI